LNKTYGAGRPLRGGGGLLPVEPLGGAGLRCIYTDLVKVEEKDIDVSNLLSLKTNVTNKKMKRINHKMFYLFA